MSTYLAAMTFLVLSGMALVLGPLLFVWMLNTLCKLELPYDIRTWFASLLALSMFAVLAQ